MLNKKIHFRANEEISQEIKQFAKDLNMSSQRFILVCVLTIISYLKQEGLNSIDLKASRYFLQEFNLKKK